VAVEAGRRVWQVVLTTTKTRKQAHPRDAQHRQVLKKDFRRKAKTIVKLQAED